MTEITEAAKLKACELAPGSPSSDCLTAFARYIAQVSDAIKDSGLGITPKPLESFILPDPVDPLLIEARKLAADDIACAGSSWAVESDDGHRFYGVDAMPVILAGNADKSQTVLGRLRALKRGMELAS